MCILPNFSLPRKAVFWYNGGMTNNLKRTAALGIVSTAIFAASPSVGGTPLTDQAKAAADLAVCTQAAAEAAPLFLRAIGVYANATARQRRHEAELRTKGIAEVPSEGMRYTVNTSGLLDLVFDDRGELSLDRRFLTDDDMKVVKDIEKWIAKWFPSETAARAKPRKSAGVAGMPVFRGFESTRYQQHDALIAKIVADFNAHKALWCDGTAAQAAKIPDLDPAILKSQMIEETGGNGSRSRAAWAIDPLQVNVPGDWGAEKELVGLTKPAKRNEGSLENNLRAGLKYLVRKGFATSAKPAKSRPNGFFDGWKKAIQRYNGRRDRTDTDRYYSDEYADKIMRRAENADVFEPIQIKLAK